MFEIFLISPGFGLFGRPGPGLTGQSVPGNDGAPGAKVCSGSASESRSGIFHLYVD